MIGEAMPRFDRLQTAFSDNDDFQQVMGLFYSDIVEFHERAYKFFRRRGESISAETPYIAPVIDVVAWTMVFDSLWKTFNPRFQGILESLRRHRNLIDQEANTINVSEARSWRTEQLNNFKQ